MNKLYKLLICFLPLLLWSTEVNQSKEQILRLNFLGGTPKYLHPHLACDSSSFIICQALFEGITRLDLAGKVELALAQKIRISKCKTKYTIYLRPSVWSNGVELTAYHFVNTWKAAISPNTKCNRPSRFFIIKNAKKVFQGELPIEKVGIYAPEKYQIIVHLENPAPYFTKLLASPSFAPLFDVSKEKIEVFNGPFILKNLQQGRGIQLTKNILYWDAQIVRLNSVEISLIQNEITAYKLFQKGKLDFIGSPLSDLPEDIMQESKKLIKLKTHGLYGIYFCISDPKVQSKKIRRALSLAVNREHIADYILPNANPNYSILPQGLSYLKLNHEKEQIENIQKLFKEGLKELNYKRENYSIELSCANMSRHTKIAEYLKHCWEGIFNIKVVLRKSDWNTFYTKLRSHEFTVGGCARFAAYEDPIDFLEFFLSSDRNYSNWENPKFNKLVDLANKTTSDKKRIEYLQKAEEILMEDCPVISLYTHKHLYLCNPALRNFIPSKLIYCDFRWAYFEKD